MNIFGRFIEFKVIPFIKKWNLLNVIIVAIDILAITLAFQCSYYINYLGEGGFFFSTPRLLKLYLLIVPFWLVFLYILKANEIPRTKRYSAMFYQYFQSTLLIAVLLLVFYFVFKLAAISRLFLIEFSLFGFIFLFIARTLEYMLFKTYRIKGHNYKNIALITDDSAITFIDSLIRRKEWGYRIVQIFSNSIKIRDKYRSSIEVLPERYGKVLYDYMEIEPIDEVWYVKDNIAAIDVRNIVRSCEELGVTFRLNHTETRDNLTNAFTEIIADRKFLTFINVPYSPSSLTVKTITDVFVSILAIIILSPLFIAIALAIFFTSRGPVIFSQERIGLRGRPFRLFKFRTMVADAEDQLKELESRNESDGPTFKIAADPRITNIGKFLRRSGLDELPQLFNVLKGEMSLIGPRPPLESETRQYKRWQLRRLSVKPGLSCFWQIKPERNSIKFEKWMEMDLAYIDNWSLRLDMLILVKTIKTIFQRSGL
ncbi:MAG TPA: sugar transferase [Bacteroidales bacterium]|nr:sugar transferase [Bacteroidales bacterium]HQK68411.1 sugar transferase [Bacteroidales bacterium]